MNPVQVVAVIDDELALRESLTLALSSEGYAVRSFSSADEAWENLRSAPPDLILLDILMPGLDGREFCRLWRDAHPGTPLIFLSSISEEQDRLEALGLGADDYLTKPFSLAELLIRIKVCFLRQQRLEKEPLRREEPSASAPFVLLKEQWAILFRGAPLALTVTEYRILAALVGNPRRVFSREDLIEAAYPRDGYVSDRNVDAHIRRIRRKIEEADRTFTGIEAVYGLGYRYIPHE